MIKELLISLIITLALIYFINKKKLPVSKELKSSPEISNKLVHQLHFSYNVPERIYEAVKTNMDKNKDWTFKFYDAKDADNFVRKNYSEYYVLFRSINPSSFFKTELFKCLVLHKKGGVFLDIEESFEPENIQYYRPNDSFITSVLTNFISHPLDVVRFIPDIPKVIYMTYKNHSVPKKIFDNWKIKNPEYTISFFDDEMCHDFLLKEYCQDFAAFFNEIEYGAIKSDFWRLCVLYKYGGVYSDVDIVPLIPLSDYITGVSFFSTIAELGKSIFQAVIAVLPQSKIIKECIDILYSKRGLKLTYQQWSGTDDMYRVLRKYIGDCADFEGTHHAVIDGQDEIIRLAAEECPEINLHSCGAVFSGITLFKSRYENYVRGGMKGTGVFE